MSFTEKTPHLSECCPAATFSFSWNDRHACALECLEDGGEACCYDNCFAEHLGIFVEGKIVVGGFVGAIVNGNAGIHGIKTLAEEAVRECETGYSKKFPFAAQYENSITCDMPDKLYMISKCILAFIFKNCPKLKASHSCEELKKTMEHCEELTTTIATIPPSTTEPPSTLPPTEPVIITTTTTDETSTQHLETTGDSQGSSTQVAGT